MVQEKESPMAFSESLANRIRDVLARKRIIEEKKMFGCICFCKRPFAWRKKWAKVWEQVKYCLDACRKKSGR
jgi:hypothetical protein